MLLIENIDGEIIVKNPDKDWRPELSTTMHMRGL
jgi:hypothetical protein